MRQEDHKLNGHGISRIRTYSPEPRAPQEDIAQWIAREHARTYGSSPSEMLRKIDRVGCKSDKIQSRSIVFPGFSKDIPHPLTLSDRHDLYAREADLALRSLFEEVFQAPSELIHVTCTGYLSPSPAQRLVERMNWNQQTGVTHFYHMGCYASIPALKWAHTFSRANRKTMEVAHTEFCSLHFDAQDNHLDQFVIQTLFGDGAAAYRVGPLPEDEDSLEILAVKDRIVPGTSDRMTWVPGDSSFRMTLARNVPALLKDNIDAFVRELLDLSGLNEAPKNTHYAVHPGGPAILDEIESTLRLEPWQIAMSRKVLYHHGNLSSATLPFIWSEILSEREIPAGTPIISLAFGPGLTLAGAVLIKRERQL